MRHLSQMIHVISEVPGFHQLPKRLCAFARVAVRCAVALGKWEVSRLSRRGRWSPGPASLGRAGALAGRGKRLDLSKMEEVTKKGWNISHVFFCCLVVLWIVHVQQRNTNVQIVVVLWSVLKSFEWAVASPDSWIQLRSMKQTYTCQGSHSKNKPVVVFKSLRFVPGSSFIHIHPSIHACMHAFITAFIHAWRVRSIPFIHSVRHEGKVFHSFISTLQSKSFHNFGANFQKKRLWWHLHIHSTEKIPTLEFSRFKIQIASLFRGHSTTKRCNLTGLHPQNHHKQS